MGNCQQTVNNIGKQNDYYSCSIFVIKIDNLHQQMLSKRRHHASMSVQRTSCEHSHTKPRRKSESASCAQQALNTKLNFITQTRKKYENI